MIATTTRGGRMHGVPGGMTEELAPQPAPANQKREGRRLYVQGVEGNRQRSFGPLDRKRTKFTDRSSESLAGGRRGGMEEPDHSSQLPGHKDGASCSIFYVLLYYFGGWDGTRADGGRRISPPFLREVLLEGEDGWRMRKGEGDVFVGIGPFGDGWMDRREWVGGRCAWGRVGRIGSHRHY